MDYFQGITVEIISNGQVMEFYDDPDSVGMEQSHARHHYVEALTAGSTFQVEVNLTPKFNLKKMEPKHAIFIQVSIDGKSNCSAKLLTKEYLQKKFLRDKLGGCVFTGLDHFCKETGQWMRSEYSFGNLVLKETHDPGFSVKQAEDLGKIEVLVKRVETEGKKVYEPSAMDTAIIEEAPEKALKGRPIESTFRLANSRPISPSHIKTTYSHIRGAAGEPVVFNIYYRSRRALQMLGCIPRSPSPAIDISDDEANEAAMELKSTNSSDALLRQIQTLNARISDLERLKTKTETTNTGTVIKREGSSLKREREEDDGRAGARQRRRTSVKIEHIDLTD